MEEAGWVVHAFETKKQWQGDLCELGASLTYMQSSKAAMNMQ